MSDERKQLPSASGVERLYLCPGSFLLSFDAPPEPPPADWTITGNVVHDALRARNFAGLTDDQTELAKQCLRLEREFAETYGFLGSDTKRFSERRLWLRNGSTLLMSGKGDLILLRGTVVAAIDYKTGRGPVTAPADNWQLKSELVMLDSLWDWSEGYGVIIQPWNSPQLRVHKFNRSELPTMDILLRDILRRAFEPDAPRIPGPKQCKFCPAKGICPEAGGKALAPLSWKNPAITGRQLAQELPLYKLAEEIIEARRDVALQVKQACPSALPGYRITTTKEREYIDDAPEVYRRLNEQTPLSPEEILSCCSISISKLRLLWARKNKINLDDAREALPYVLGELMQKRLTKQTLEKI